MPKKKAKAKAKTPNNSTLTTEENPMDFKDILNTSVDEISQPITIPMGTWRFKIVSGKLKENKHDSGPIADALFTVTPIEATDDVSEVELEAYSSEMSGDRIFHKVSLWEKRDRWNVVRFLNALGVEFEEGDTLGKSIANSKNYEFVAYVQHAENDKDPERPYVNLTDIRASE